MNINGLDMSNSPYSQLVQATQKYEDTASKDYTKATEAELMDACKEFEAYFVEQMFKSLQKMVPESEYTSSSNKTMTEYYMDKLSGEYADMSTAQGDGLGIAQMLFEQMKRNYEL